MTNQTDSKRIIIVGAGLAGSLMSLYLAKRGFEVEVYEKRPDMRVEKIRAGKSINLALSTRGIRALKEVGLDEFILKKVIPMKGRMIHPVEGDLTFQPYGSEEWQVINSISRAQLNTVLMDAAERTDKVKLFFKQKCTGMNFKNGEIYFIDMEFGRRYKRNPETIIAADGANSTVRMSLLKSGRFNYSQSYLQHGYKELEIPAGEDGGFHLEKNALHIWPRKSFMMIALPNADGSFTCTLFLRFEGQIGFDRLSSSEAVRTFYEEHFPDAVPLISNLQNDFLRNPTGNLITVKCFPWRIGSEILLLGDSAHAIVPFYGQGMNCAFEDCTYLSACIDKYGDDWESVYSEFEKTRKRDTDAIADLALENFIEMRDSIADPHFLMKKKAEILLEEKFPGKFQSKYVMVTFSDIPYSTAMEKGRVQDEILMKLCSKIDSIEQLNLEEAFGVINKKLNHK
jgi:kynurenine 3-monooxygenase